MRRRGRDSAAGACSSSSTTRSSARRSASPAAAAATSPTSTRARRITCRRTRISAARRLRATRRRISCSSSSVTASPGTKRSSASSSATSSSRDIIAMLEGRVRARRRATGGMPCAVHAVTRERERLYGRDGAAAASRCASLVIATGGLTVPKIGATPFGYRIARAVRPGRRPAAAGAGSARLRRPMRSRTTAICPASRSMPTCRCGEGRFRESVLFTHRGLSGPGDPADFVVLGRRRRRSHVDLLPDIDAPAWLATRTRGRMRGSTPCWPSGCRSGSHSSGARRDASRCRCARSAASALRTLAAELRRLAGAAVGDARLQQGGSDGWAASIRARCRRRRWRRRRCPASISSARSST